MFKDVWHHVAFCWACQICNTQKIHIPVTISTTATIFSKVHLDIMYMPNDRGFRYILIARDDLSKYAEGKALKQASAKAVPKFVMEDLIFRYGFINKIVTDNGPKFQGELVKLLEKYNLPYIPISPYNSQANGVVEQGHFAIREAIVKACQGKIQDWPSKLKATLFADNITVHRSTGYSAYYLLHGIDPLLPFDLTESTFMVEEFKEDLSTSDLLALCI